MRKIPTIYIRDPATNFRYVVDEQNPVCDWVFTGEGRPTFKWDGTAVLVDWGGAMWKRRAVKPGEPPPPDFEEVDRDVVTGKRFGWVPCRADNPADLWHFEAYDNSTPDGGWTYELIGPKVNGNRHNAKVHALAAHGARIVDCPNPPTFGELGEWLHDQRSGFEGIVWYHDDGRTAKIKVRDFPR